jgi:hypothetical protein
LAAERGGGRPRNPGWRVNCAKRAMKWFLRNWSKTMLDFFYVAVGCLFLLGCWAFTKACDRL